jgi:hypothetical protein
VHGNTTAFSAYLSPRFIVAVGFPFGHLYSLSQMTPLICDKFAGHWVTLIPYLGTGETTIAKEPVSVCISKPVRHGHQLTNISFVVRRPNLVYIFYLRQVKRYVGLCPYQKKLLFRYCSKAFCCESCTRYL